MDYVEYLNREVELDNELLDAKNRQRIVNDTIYTKLIELETSIKNNKNAKRDLRSQRFERLKQKLLLKTVNRRIRKTNNIDYEIVNRFLNDDDYITLSDLKSLMGNLDFLSLGTEKELKLDQTNIQKEKYVKMSNELYTRLKETLRNEKTRYVIYRNQKAEKIVEISSNISNLKKAIATRNIEIKSIKKQLKELNSKKLDVNKLLQSTSDEMMNISFEFANEDAPKTKLKKKDS